VVLIDAPWWFEKKGLKGSVDESADGTNTELVVPVAVREPSSKSTAQAVLWP
jgi:hypothetical protein